MALKAGNTTCSMVFRGQDVDCGWTETFQSSIIDLTQAASALEACARKRVLFLSARYSIDYLRISKVQAPVVAPARNQRVAFLQRVDLGGSLDPTGDGDLPFVAALIRFYNTDKTVFGLREMRGVPDKFWTNNDDKDAQARLKGPINAYVAALQANNMGMNHKLPAGGVALVLIALGVYERLTHRSTGRPLYLPRGRR
jgi:hypothetical protein